MGDTFYVTHKTKVKCPLATTDSVELKSQGHGVFKMNGLTPLPVMNITETKADADVAVPTNNIPSFGNCQNPINPDIYRDHPDLNVPQLYAKTYAQILAEAPTKKGACKCRPVFATPWINGATQTLTAGPTLNKDCFIVCTKGFGVVKIEGNTAGGIIPPAEIQKYVYTPSGTGYPMQKEMNDYLKNNVWNSKELSNNDKIAITVACYDSLSDEQKVDFNMYADARVIKYDDYTPWTGDPVSWPTFPGVDFSKPIISVDATNVPKNVDRIGYIGGKNFGVIPDSGEPYDMEERAIPYLENEDSFHQYEIDTENYCAAMDCIRDNDKEKLNALIDEMNEKNNTSINHVTDVQMKKYNASYNQFQTECADLRASNPSVDTTYGVMGPAAPWEADDGSGLAYSGGAIQFNSPVGGDIMKNIGILKEV